MFNRERTLAIFGYDIDPNKRRRSDAEVASTKGLSKKQLMVVDNCPSCQKERQIKYRASLKNRLCSKCFHATPEMQEAKKNQNKVKSEETKAKMKANHWSIKGVVSAFRGQTHTDQTKQILSDKTKLFLASLSSEEKVKRYIKASCTVRNISLTDFDGWATEEGVRLRGTEEYKIFEDSVFERDQKCVYPGCIKRMRSKIVIHHKDAFSWCVDKRTDVNNGVTLCTAHHDEFHSIYSRKNNTEDQFLEWIADASRLIDKTKRLFIVTGAPGSGKSWVCNQLKDSIFYLGYDSIPRDQHSEKIVEMFRHKDQIVFDPLRKSLQLFKRYSQFYTVELLVISEGIGVIKKRIKDRGGDPDNSNIDKYLAIFTSISKRHATFSGTSQEVLDYLKGKCL